MRARAPGGVRQLPRHRGPEQRRDVGLRHARARAPEHVGAQQAEDRLAVVGVVRREVDRRREAELLQQRPRAGVEVEHAVVERERHAARRQRALVQSAHRLAERQDVVPPVAQHAEPRLEHGGGHGVCPRPLVLVVDRDAVVAQDQEPPLAPRTVADAAQQPEPRRRAEHAPLHDDGEGRRRARPVRRRRRADSDSTDGGASRTL